MRHSSVRILSLVLILLLLTQLVGAGQDPHAPVIEGNWVRPSPDAPAQSVWGHADGLRIGLWPLPGPRGLLRVYAPYLGHSHDRMINYIAVEPVLQGEFWRSFSELEESALDGVQGMRFWSANSLEDEEPRDPAEPARGVLSWDGEVEILSVYIFIEPFRSGARVVLRLDFRSDKPYQVGLSTFTQSGSAPIAMCILTATMGNFARLRTLHLGSGTQSSLDMWPAFSGEGFADHICFPLDDLIRTSSGDALFLATPNEEDPVNAEYAPGTFIGWHYYGDVATQYWRREDPPLELRGCVNARETYWASDAKIPGGISFENFELIELFSEGAQSWFGVVPELYEPADGFGESLIEAGAP